MKIRDVTDEEQKTRKEENTMHLRKDETMLEDIQKIKKDINLLPFRISLGIASNIVIYKLLCNYFPI